MLIAVYVLKLLPVRTYVLGFTLFRLRFRGILRGQFVPRTWFDRVPAGTVLSGTWLFKARSYYKKWCVPRTCSRWNCTENKCERLDKVTICQRNSSSNGQRGISDERDFQIVWTIDGENQGAWTRSQFRWREKRLIETKWHMRIALIWHHHIAVHHFLKVQSIKKYN